MGRAVCVTVLLMSIMQLGAERFTQLFAVLFALCSGMALLWEDAVLCNLDHLFGGARERIFGEVCFSVVPSLGGDGSMKKTPSLSLQSCDMYSKCSECNVVSVLVDLGFRL